MQRLEEEEKKIGLLATNTLAEKIKDFFSLKSVLSINASTFGTFSKVTDIADVEIANYPKATNNSNTSIIIGDPFSVLEQVDDNYDLIIGDLPLGYKGADKRVEWKDGNINIKAKKNWIIILKSLFKLTRNGYGLFLVEPAILWSQEWKRFTAVFNDLGFYINAIFNSPKNILLPETSLRPIIILVSRSGGTGLFIAEISDADSVVSILRNLTENKSSHHLETGVFVNESVFKGFNNYKITKQIEKLQTQYKEFKELRLVDISTEISLGKQNKKFEEKTNALYIPRVCNTPVVYSLRQTTLKHQNYFQIVLDQSVVLNEYVSLFFSSDLGRLVLESLYGSTIFPTTTKKDLEQVSIPIPSINEQKIIITANHKLEKLEKSIDDFKRELSLNPKSPISIQDKIDDMLQILDSLSDVDRMRSLIRKGESKTLEFKQTFSLNIHTDIKDENIRKSSLKTIVAFLNTDGGNLLIGVGDEGNVTGLGGEMAKFRENEDKFLLNFNSLIKAKIGEDFYPFIEYRIVDIDKAKVLFVECKPSTSPCYYDEEEFFVRTNPATNQLKGPKLVEYIKRHFSN
ncbi:MAG: Divergent AAA domain protein [ANME-2 cluster archaeon HR1]|nr:MAG: putative transcriptional regulator, contains HTH domain/Restriction endonuclease S subunit [ANME-2 cluster archaeon]PPA78368.1 MAG: Divergent AAA domain protein [ANME-2 cluster archaeon HR1]